MEVNPPELYDEQSELDGVWCDVCGAHHSGDCAEPTETHKIDEISGDDSTGYYAEGHSKILHKKDGNSWFCFELEDLGEITRILHEELGFSTKEIQFAMHDHTKCLVNFGIASLREGCEGQGHAAAVSEAGYCPVCQH